MGQGGNPASLDASPWKHLQRRSSLVTRWQVAIVRSRAFTFQGSEFDLSSDNRLANDKSRENLWHPYQWKFKPCPRAKQWRRERCSSVINTKGKPSNRERMENGNGVKVGGKEGDK